MARHSTASTCILNSAAWSILGKIPSGLADAIEVQVDRGDVAVRIQVAPSNDGEGGDGVLRYPGTWLSSTEQLIWNALAERALLGKQIAAKLGWEYSTKLKFLLSNLEDRGVLLHDETSGYSRAELPG